MMQPRSLDHIVIFVKNLKRTEAFYSRFLDEPGHEYKNSISYKIGATKIFFGVPYRQSKRAFDKEELGLNHLAFGVKKLSELKAFESVLDKAKIKHSGIQIERHAKKQFIWFDDPDGLRLEFYLRK
jgi:catechol 2,3-dioxygenase-like lactoylglutathione lyase family enzyme